jgi:hypothetical protein
MWQWRLFSAFNNALSKLTKTATLLGVILWKITEIQLSILSKSYILRGKNSLNYQTKEKSEYLRAHDAISWLPCALRIVQYEG